MQEKTGFPIGRVDERRGRSGTWPWFALNVILFPAPAHFTLLRVREFSFGRIIRHLGMTFFLAFLLLLSACLQVVVPKIGAWWMLIPALSGLAVLFANRHLKAEHTPLNFHDALLPHAGFLLALVLLFISVIFLPFLDLIELNRGSVKSSGDWLKDLPFWQEILILMSGLCLLLAGHALNAGGCLSINRTVILFACFILFYLLILSLLLTSYGWLRVRGGFFTQFAAILLAAVLALDYWDARTFGQFSRRFFFLTATKGLSFVFLWLCLLGLPQKAAAEISAYQFEKMTRDYARLSPEFLVYKYRGYFNDAHTASRRMRALYTEAFLEGDTDRLNRIAGLTACQTDGPFPRDSDVCRLARKITAGEMRTTSIDVDSVPIFRPIHPHWDVMLTALLAQGAISKPDLDRFIADFKTALPKSARGRLPDIDAPHETRYVALAAGVEVDFLPPRWEMVDILLENGFHPLFTIRLDGRRYWTTILRMDKNTGICWLRLTTPKKTKKAIQLHFDADKASDFKQDILSRILAPFPIEYLEQALNHCSGPLIVFSPKGLHSALPEQFPASDLAELDRAVAFAADPQSWSLKFAIPTDERSNPFSAYASYLRTVAAAKSMLKPRPYNQDVFFHTLEDIQAPTGPARLRAIESLIAQAAPLRDSDRMDLAVLLVKHGHDLEAPDLFFEMAAEKPFSSDIIDCADAFRIGRRLFLMGKHEAGNGYLQTASKRHPFYAEFDMWRHIALAKLGRPQENFRTPPERKPDLYRYYQTLVDVQAGDLTTARRRLEKALKEDSHNSMVRHLLHRYCDAPLDDRYFFPAPEGL